MVKMKKDLIVGTFFLIFGALYFSSAFSIGTYKGYASQNISSAFIPKLLGILLMFLSACLLYQTVMAWKRLKKDLEASPHSIQEPQQGYLFFKPEEIRSLVAVFASLAAYIALMEPVGFILSSCGFLFVAIRIMAPDGKFNWRMTALLSAIVPICIYALFVYGLDMVLPEGILG